MMNKQRLEYLVKLSPFMHDHEKLMTKEERQEVLNRWDGMSGASCFMDAMRKLYEEIQ